VSKEIEDEAFSNSYLGFNVKEFINKFDGVFFCHILVGSRQRKPQKTETWWKMYQLQGPSDPLFYSPEFARDYLKSKKDLLSLLLIAYFKSPLREGRDLLEIFQEHKLKKKRWNKRILANKSAWEDILIIRRLFLQVFCACYCYLYWCSSNGTVRGFRTSKFFFSFFFFHSVNF